MRHSRYHTCLGVPWIDGLPVFLLIPKVTIKKLHKRRRFTGELPYLIISFMFPNQHRWPDHFGDWSRIPHHGGIIGYPVGPRFTCKPTPHLFLVEVDFLHFPGKQSIIRASIVIPPKLFTRFTRRNYFGQLIMNVQRPFQLVSGITSGDIWICIII